MVNLPVVLIVLEIGKRAADTKAGGSFHAYSYTKKYVKVKGKCLPNVYDKFLLLKYINIYIGIDLKTQCLLSLLCLQFHHGGTGQNIDGFAKV